MAVAKGYRMGTRSVDESVLGFVVIQMYIPGLGFLTLMQCLKPILALESDFKICIREESCKSELRR